MTRGVTIAVYAPGSSPSDPQKFDAYWRLGDLRFKLRALDPGSHLDALLSKGVLIDFAIFLPKERIPAVYTLRLLLHRN